MQQATLRAVAEGERAEVARVVLDSYAEFAPSLTPEDWARMRGNLMAGVAEGAEGELLVATIGERIAGTITYIPPGPRIYDRVPFEWALIRFLAVLPDHRGRGIGKTLTRQCLHRAREDGAAIVGLHTAEMFTVARTMYERMGFAQQRAFTHHGVRFWIYSLHL